MSDDDRLIIAIGRIERALSRIEAANSRQADNMLAEFTDLFQRHELLKEKAGQAVARLDQLVDASQEA
jgi:hypothetical protein